jgi:hypothetical protein
MTRIREFITQDVTESTLHIFPHTMLASLRRIDTSLVEEQEHVSRTPDKRDIYHMRDSISYGAHNH